MLSFAIEEKNWKSLMLCFCNDYKFLLCFIACRTLGRTTRPSMLFSSTSRAKYFFFMSTAAVFFVALSNPFFFLRNCCSLSSLNSRYAAFLFSFTCYQNLKFRLYTKFRLASALLHKSWRIYKHIFN